MERREEGRTVRQGEFKRKMGCVTKILWSTVSIHTYRQSIHSPNLFSYCKDIQQGLGRMFPYPIPCIDHWFMGHSASSLGCPWLRVTENYDITVGLHHVDGIWEKTGREGRDKGSGNGEGRGRGSKWEGRDKRGRGGEGKGEGQGEGREEQVGGRSKYEGRDRGGREGQGEGRGRGGEGLSERGGVRGQNRYLLRHTHTLPIALALTF